MKTCDPCGTDFEPRTTRQKFCSKTCNKRAHRDRPGQCSADGCERAERAKGLCVSHYNRAHHPGSQQRCPGDPERRRRQLRAKTQRRRAVARDPEAETVDRDVVGGRDGWKCGICRHKVNRALPYPHPRSASLDHIVPLSQHGKHVYSNVRITHLTCNTARGNRGGGEQLLLVG